MNVTYCIVTKQRKFINTLLNYVFHLIFVGFADYLVLNNLMLQLELFHNKRMKVETGSTFDKFRSKSVAVLIVIPVSSATRSTARKITHFPCLCNTKVLNY